MNVRPGDLAFVVDARTIPENNGKLVGVVEPFTGDRFAGLRIAGGTEMMWIVRATGSLLHVLAHHDATGDLKKYRTIETLMPDRCLRAIRPYLDGAVDEMVALVGKPPASPSPRRKPRRP